MFTAYIGNDPIASKVTVGCRGAKAAAQAARHYAKLGEIITVIGPRGGRTDWEAVGTGLTATVWKKGKAAA